MEVEEGKQLRTAYAVLMLACPFISGFNKLSGIVSLRPGERPMGKFDARISRRGQRGVYSSAFRPPCVLFLWVLVVVALVLAAPHAGFRVRRGADDGRG